MSGPAPKRLGLVAVGLLAGFFFSQSRTNANADDARPIVAGFERFADDPKTDPAEAGRLLLGELNCTSCHRIDPAFAAHLNRKQAPILDGIGNRARPAALRAFLAAPHVNKTGTTMPDLLAGLHGAEKEETVEALTQFLGSTGNVPHARVDRKAVSAGRLLYQQVGCAVCHGQSGEKANAGVVSVPLGPIEEKYTIPSLTAFLLDPLKARPSGRMPGMVLKNEEASQIAQFLLRNLKGKTQPSLDYRYYELESSPEKMPDLSKLEPKGSGVADNFDVGLASRHDNIALHFEGQIQIRREGQYRFLTASDDGSKLYIDGNLVVDNDGIHPNQGREGIYRLGRGTHRVVVDFFNAAGQIELDVDFEGPGLNRQPLAGFLTPKEIKNAPKSNDADDRLALKPELVEKGRTLFTKIGCASCHQMSNDQKAIVSTLDAPALAAVSPEKGCLAEKADGTTPRYDLSEGQRLALRAAIQSIAKVASQPPTHAQTITRTLTAFNCYACHQRDGRGGVEPTRNDLFTTTQKEMGDEGRLPPWLTGVGAKLNDRYLHQVADAGAKDRPYMLTRMPRFGGGNVGPVVAAFEAVDTIEPVPLPNLDETTRRVKSDGRFLVGGMGLGCVKCHTFKGVQAEGIQAIDMTIMTQRLRRDWFHRYVVNPPAFRPGTRMPTGWPDGKTMLPKLLGGDTVRQVEAVWQYLSDGGSAAEPTGLGREPMPLFVINEPVIYRNFIKGGGPRAIGVGYPEKANLAFDANDLRIALIWQGGFMDASRHWVGRGEGMQPPMGDNTLALPEGAPFARLASRSSPWPNQSSRDLGYHFRGYRLGPDRRPVFLYDVNSAQVEDHPEGVASARAPSLKRTLTLTAETPPVDLYLRVALGDSIKPRGQGAFLVNGEWTVQIEAGAEPFVRPAGGKSELLAPVKFNGKTATIVERFDW